MWWIPFHAHGHVWFTRSKSRWCLWTTDELPMDHWDACQQGSQSNLWLLWTWDFHYLPLWLCQSKYTEGRYLIHWKFSSSNFNSNIFILKPSLHWDSVLVHLATSGSIDSTCGQIHWPYYHDQMNLLLSGISAKLVLIFVSVSLSGLWWWQHELPFGWDILWNFCPCFLHIKWKLFDCSLCHWWLGAEARLQCYLQRSTM